MTDYQYYKRELGRLGGQVTVKFYSDKDDTRHLNLNKDSAKAIVNFLKKLYDLK